MDVIWEEKKTERKGDEYNEEDVDMTTEKCNHSSICIWIKGE